MTKEEFNKLITGLNNQKNTFLVLIGDRQKIDKEEPGGMLIALGSDDNGEYLSTLLAFSMDKNNNFERVIIDAVAAFISLKNEDIIEYWRAKQKGES